MQDFLSKAVDAIAYFVGKADSYVWSSYGVLPLLVLTGIYLMFGLKCMPWRYIIPAFSHMIRGRKTTAGHEGELSPFNALMASMAATVGTGNIVGVATAIMIGGPGAVFWMWVTALFGMATKCCETMLAVKFREVTPNGSYVGGPMYYIKNGLGKNFKWLAFLFAVFGMVASFGIGNMTQANSVALNLNSTFFGDGETSRVVIAFSMLLITAAVLIGGVKRIGSVAGTLVPFMAIFYIIVGLVIMGLNYEKIIPVFASIFGDAFTGTAAVGGFTGSTLALAMQSGVARGLFSNEAGLGSAPIAHATAITDSPVRQSFLGMLDPFIDTIMVCSITAITILIAGDWSNESARGTAAILTSQAFDHAIPGGRYLVSIGLMLFAYSTILGWSVYGERCCMYIFGHKASLPFRIIFSLVVPLGALAELNLVWDISDLFNGLMAIPNLVALLLLSPVCFKMVKDYFNDPANRGL
ncbi:MAG: sodium:alanine symporter family protein [Deltaproteobacteria bacterium]|jgi:AGCS family alanine or glycine:cation symporter|nr:sodium:alanine symporter family protein [Deltaproteobacteria bacterium]